MKSFSDLKKGDVVYVEWVGGATIAKTTVHNDAGAGLSLQVGNKHYDPSRVFSTWRGIFNISNGMSVLDDARSICHLPCGEIIARYKQNPQIMNPKHFGRDGGEYCNI